MTTIVDGHNLIPHVPGISLGDPDDETRLIGLLQGYCRVRRKQVDVFFDRASIGRSGERRYGSVRAVFVREGMTADEAIMAYLSGLGKRARNAIVVSSDRQVQQAARAVHAEVMPSQVFAEELQSLVDDEPQLDPRSRLLSQEEVTEWEVFFRRGHPKQDVNDD